MTRSVIVVDTETSGLDVRRHQAIEVGWVTLAGFGAGWFIPPHDLTGADPEALAVNRYSDRIAGMPVDTRFEAAQVLHAALGGNTLAGSNPAFDARFLSKLFAGADLDPEPWHHRLLDLSAYAAGIFDLDLFETEGLDKIARRLGYDPDPATAHTAYGDAVLTAACFTDLRARSRALAEATR